jgi:hypothetical protein
VIYNTNLYIDIILLCTCGFLYKKSLSNVIQLKKYLEIDNDLIYNSFQIYNRECVQKFN